MCRAYNVCIGGESYLIRAERLESIVDVLGGEAGREMAISPLGQVIPSRLDYDFCLPEESAFFKSAVRARVNLRAKESYRDAA